MKAKVSKPLVAKIEAAMLGHGEGEKTRALAWLLARDVSENITPREILTICSACDAPLKDEPKAKIPVNRVNASGAIVKQVK